MKILGIESSGLVASVAVVQDAVLLGEYTTNFKKTHSQTLLPMLDELKKMIELDLNEVDAIAISAGPGSFTGLRIGSATAKGLGLALKKPIVEVPTLEGMAFQLWSSDSVICPIMDARRSQVYTAVYEYGCKTQSTAQTGADMPDLPVCLVEQAGMDIHDLLARLHEIGRKVIFLGDGVPVYADVIAEDCKVPYSFAPAHMNAQRAGSIAALGSIYYSLGKFVLAAEHQPEYLRKSQAEREKEERK